MDQIPCGDTVVAPSGYLDEDSLCGRWPSLRTALNEGLKYTVIASAAVRAFPEIIEIGVAALNRSDTSEVSELEGLLTLHSSFARHMEAKKAEPVAWDDALADALQTNPFWASWGRSLRKFAAVTAQEQVEEARDMKAAAFKVRGGHAGEGGRGCMGGLRGRPARKRSHQTVTSESSLPTRR